MLPNQKAKELVDKFRPFVDSEICGEQQFEYSKEQETNLSKKCALIVCDVILKDVGAEDWENDQMTDSNYWQYVRKEVEAIL